MAQILPELGENLHAHCLHSHRFFHLCSLIKDSKVPTFWLDLLITPIYKPGKVKTDPAGYRPVGVSSTLCRVFKKRINGAIDHHLEEKCLIDDSQHGFRRGRSWEINLLVLMVHHAQRAEDNEDKDDCFFHLRAFFDGIPHQRCQASQHSKQPWSLSRRKNTQVGDSLVGSRRKESGGHEKPGQGAIQGAR